jgi:hypothetical protein
LPLTGDTRALQALARNLKALGTPGSPLERRWSATVREPFKPAVQAMYSEGAGPDGPWKPTVKGRQPFTGRRMPQMVAVKRVPGGFVVAWRRGWMLAQDEGHVFAARRQAQASRFFDKNGRRIGLGSLNRRALRLKFVEERTTASHAVGQRMLPARPQQPRGRMPEAWGAAVNRGAEKGMRALMEKVTGDAD